MKKIMMLSLSMIALMSCSNNDDADNQTSIVGVWKESKTVIYSGSNNAVLNTELPDDCDKKNTYEFTSNGMLNTKTFYTQSTTGLCIEVANSSDAYTYNPETKKIVVDGETTDVLSLTNNALQIVVDINDENNDGVDDKVVMFLVK